jgi:hypothetical protein
MRDALSVRVIFQRRDIMRRRTTLTLTTIALLSLAVGLPAANAVAQEKQRVSFKVSSENACETFTSRPDAQPTAIGCPQSQIGDD